MPRDILRQENQKEGTSDWLLTSVEPMSGEGIDELCRRRTSIEGYCSHASIRPGEALSVYVSTNPPSSYTAEIYRMGYYGGMGGCHILTTGPISGETQPTPEDGSRNVIECHWAESFSISIPPDALSGVYLGKLTALESGYQAYFIFIVRDDRPVDFLFQCSDLTWQAYNRWPAWRSLYDYGENKWHTSPGNEVGFDRPYAPYYNGLPSRYNPLSNGSGEFLLWEHPLCFWLEREGYDVSYISNLDTHQDPSGLRRAKGFLSVGHDEYWCQAMVENVTAARDAGLHLAFLSGNSVSGCVYLKPSSDGRSDRIFGRREDGSGHYFANEQDLMGAASHGVGAADWVCQTPDHWLFAGTGMNQGDGIPDLVGWEYHGPPLRDDPNLIVVASGNVRVYNNMSERTYAATIYDTPSGSIVFNAATCWWNMPLARPPGSVNPPRADFSQEDPRVQQITRNLLNRMAGR